MTEETDALSAALLLGVGSECDLCETPIDEPEDGQLHRWHVQDGTTIRLCEDCFGKSFAWLWDRAERAEAALREIYSADDPIEDSPGWKPMDYVEFVRERAWTVLAAAAPQEAGE